MVVVVRFPANVAMLMMVVDVVVVKMIYEES